MTKYIDENGTFEVPEGSSLRREVTIRKLTATGMSRETAEYHHDHNTVYPEIVEAILPEIETVIETDNKLETLFTGVTRDEAERLLLYMDNFESEPKPRRFNFRRGAWAIVRIGRLSFHVTRGGFTIGWVNDDYDYYHPQLRVDW